MNDSADMNLNNIPLLATHRGDVNTGSYRDDLLYTHTYDDFIVDVDNDQIAAHGWNLPSSPPTMQTPSLGDSPATPATPGTFNSVADLSTTPTPDVRAFKNSRTPNVMVPHNLFVNQDQHLKSPQQQTKHALDLGSEPQTPRKQNRSGTQTTQKVKLSRAKSYPCFIPGCTQRFKRSDFRGNHLRNKHSLPIPKGHWAKIWISKAENQEHYLAAVNLQAYASNFPSSR